MSKLTIDIKRSLAIISDTHVGSRCSLFPDKYVGSEGNVIKPNEGQLEIYKYWKYFFNEVCNRLRVDTIIHLGDALHGLNRKEAGEGLLLPTLQDQCDCFIQLIRPYLKGRKFLVVSGSGYHESLDFKVHKTIAERLNGIFCGYVADIKLKNTNRTINIAHSSGYPQIYVSTVLDREGFFLKVAEASGKIGKVDILVRGHIHIFEHIHLSTQHLVSTPCWTTFSGNPLTTKLYGRKQPDIGGIVIMIDKYDRITIHHYLMDRIPRIDNVLMDV